MFLLRNKKIFNYALFCTHVLQLSFSALFLSFMTDLASFLICQCIMQTICSMNKLVAKVQSDQDAEHLVPH